MASPSRWRDRESRDTRPVERHLVHCASTLNCAKLAICTMYIGTEERMRSVCRMLYRYGEDFSRARKPAQNRSFQELSSILTPAAVQEPRPDTFCFTPAALLTQLPQHKTFRYQEIEALFGTETQNPDHLRPACQTPWLSPLVVHM